MPVFTIETTYHLPVYRQRVYEAVSLAEACRRAVEDEGWEDEKSDVESSGDTFITGAWIGRQAYVGQALPIPSQYDETLARKVAHLDAVVALLREAAQPLGLSRSGFAGWLPRAQAAVAKAEAIAAGARDPD